MLIRSALVDDIDKLIHLWSERINLLTQVDKRFASTSYREDVLGQQVYEYLNNQDTPIFIALVNEGIGGFIVTEICDSDGVIHEIALDAHQYHGGMGRELVKYSREYFFKQGVKQIIVKVPRFHPVEQAFWLALGAKEWKNQAWKNPPEFMWMIL